MRASWIVIASVVGLVAFRVSAQEERECPPNRFHVLDNRFHFVASSDQGAVGDVVGIDVGLVSEVPHPGPGTLGFVCCYDPAKLELLGEPEQSDEFGATAFMAGTKLFTSSRGRTGLSLHGAIGIPNASRFFPDAEPLPIATLYFRVRAAPGDTTPVSFCDGMQYGTQCLENGAGYSAPSGWVQVYSQSHIDGEVRILAGEPTRPDAPAMPALARVYGEAPTTESAGIQLELSGAVARPGAREVPLSVYATSSLEFSGFALSIVFPAEHLALARVEQHTRPGACFMDNDEGHFALAMMNSNRRVAAEGERVRLATLYFDVKESASAVAELEPSFSEFVIEDRHYFNSLRIRHGTGETLELPQTASVEPLIVADGLLKIQMEPAALGDANLDEAVDVSDPVAILRWLFQGAEEPLCRGAADFNRDGGVDVADAIGILWHLFQGGGDPGPSAFCDA